MLGKLRTYFSTPQHAKLFSVIAIISVVLAVIFTTFVAQTQQTIKQEASSKTLCVDPNGRIAPYFSDDKCPSGWATNSKPNETTVITNTGIDKISKCVIDLKFQEFCTPTSSQSYGNCNFGSDCGKKVALDKCQNDLSEDQVKSNLYYCLNSTTTTCINEPGKARLGNPLIQITPREKIGVAGTELLYDVYLRDNNIHDAIFCSGEKFKLEAVCPEGFTCKLESQAGSLDGETVSGQYVTLSNQEPKYATLRVASSLNSKLGSHIVDVKATRTYQGAAISFNTQIKGVYTIYVAETKDLGAAIIINVSDISILENANTAGKTIATSASLNSTATGNTLASWAKTNPNATGQALVQAILLNPKATANAIAQAASVDVVATVNALMAGPANNPAAMSALGEFLPADTFVSIENSCKNGGCLAGWTALLVNLTGR